VHSSVSRQLAYRAAEGDQAALAQLYEEYLDTVYRYVSYKVSDATVGKDLTSEVFVKAWARTGRFSVSQVAFPLWLVRIAREVVINYPDDER
jgi:RNA polymerase sigma-70 factor, ECF subfamily